MDTGPSRQQKPMGQRGSGNKLNRSVIGSISLCSVLAYESIMVAEHGMCIQEILELDYGYCRWIRALKRFTSLDNNILCQYRVTSL